MKKKIAIVTFILVIILSSISLLLINKPKKSEKIVESLQKEEVKEEVNNIKNSRIDKVKELKKENPDIIGWLQIENSKINYPILQGKDNSFYMTHDYKKEYSKDGSLFLDKAYDFTVPSTNLLIYGHNNIGSKEMFVDLIKYKDKEFYNNHKIIRFTTDKEDAKYEIISVFLSRVYYKSEKDVFRYYFFINAGNEKEFNDYVTNAKKASLHEIDATAKYRDQLLTLSTCSYHTEDGRLAVVARKIK